MFSVEPERYSIEADCLTAVRQDAYELQYVSNQTEEICLCAVRQNGWALQYVKNQTKEICLCAVRQNGWALQYVSNQTEAICIEAVNANCFSLQYVENQTEDMCMKAIKKEYASLSFVQNQTYAMCMCMCAINDCIKAIYFFRYPSITMIDEILSIHPDSHIYFQKTYVAYLVKNYNAYNNILPDMSNHYNELLYRPNNIKSIECDRQWITASTKYLFLT